MEQIKPFSDERWASFCAFCGDFPATRDHVPPKIFLDKPYPENLPVVGACLDCNTRASVNEEYVACLLEVASCGSVDPAALSRDKIARILRKKPSIATKLASFLEGSGELFISKEDKGRISAVLEKIASALWAFETGETASPGAAGVRFSSIPGLAPNALEEFMMLDQPGTLPEVGSRMMSRVLITEDGKPLQPSWIELQSGRFSYGIELGYHGRVKMILGDYLVVEVDMAGRG